MSIVDITMPKWGMTMQEGTLAAWTCAVGDQVSEGDVIAEVSTDKADADIEAPVDGTVVEILVEAEATVEVGTLIARMDDGR